MALGIQIPMEYGYIVLDLVMYFILHLWMGNLLDKAREKYNVPYPTMYAVERNMEAKLFNTVQIGRQNSIDYMPVFFVMLLVGGLQHSLISAGLGALYIISLFFYFKHSAAGNPDSCRRLMGLSFLALLGLIICTVSFGINLLTRDVL
ncbi:Microsomal glutathione S-transferase 3 [Rhynchospora pubera]|uniref:Glutathione S-transferase 3, mitochondrial n=1 Tax=Rhynchospora pubera TaxID=906938 RepID=A0AAV8CMI8_9POAL|nr:Microsomal glutathione S-transferase 3 [Rhynchospora pubera]